MSDDDPEDVTITLDMSHRHGRLFRAALDYSRGPMLPGIDDVLIASIAVAVYCEGPDPTRPDQGFAKQLGLAIPGEAWDQFLPVDRLLTTIPGMEAVLRAADRGPLGS